jgi:hypothetical protein
MSYEDRDKLTEMVAQQVADLKQVLARSIALSLFLFFF